MPAVHRSFLRAAERARSAALLLHGAGGSPADFHFLASDLARHGVSTLCPLLPSHGRGDEALTTVRLDALADRAFEAFDALAADGVRPAVVGQSVGAVLGIRVAAEREPSCFAALAPALRPRVARRVLALVPALWARPRLAVATWRWQTAMHRGIRATAECIPRIRCPLLVLQSRDDGSVSLRGARELADGAASPAKRLVLLERQGHVLSTAPDRERVFGPVREFLTGTTAGDRSGT